MVSKIHIFTFIIHLADVMLQPVAHHQKVDMEQKIVNRNLVEYFLCDGDVRGFVLDDHAGLQFTGVEHTVGAQHLVATFQLDFVGEQRGRITPCAR